MRRRLSHTAFRSPSCSSHRAKRSSSTQQAPPFTADDQRARALSAAASWRREHPAGSPNSPSTREKRAQIRTDQPEISRQRTPPLLSAPRRAIRVPSARTPSPLRCSLGASKDLVDLAAETHEGRGGSDEANDAVVELVEAERARGDEDVEAVLHELVARRRLLTGAASRASRSSTRRVSEGLSTDVERASQASGEAQTHALMVLSSTLRSSAFSLPNARRAAASRCWRPYSLYTLQTIEHAMPVIQRRAARCWTRLYVTGESGTTFAEWSCDESR